MNLSRRHFGVETNHSRVLKIPLFREEVEEDIDNTGGEKSLAYKYNAK